jgi:hypothetical protein
VELLAGQLHITREQAKAQFEQSNFLRTLATVQDTANAAVLIASDRARMLTGTVVNASAGAALDCGMNDKRKGRVNLEDGMGKVIFGNHTAVFAARSEQDRIRRFYCGVLGCKARVQTEEVDRFELEDFHFCFVYQGTALNESDFLKAIYLELKTDSTEEIRKKILAFGAKKIEIPDLHFYFQAPGGQVFKLVGINEDLSLYEDSPSSRPGSPE